MTRAATCGCDREDTDAVLAEHPQLRPLVTTPPHDHETVHELRLRIVCTYRHLAGVDARKSAACALLRRHCEIDEWPQGISCAAVQVAWKRAEERLAVTVPDGHSNGQAPNAAALRADADAEFEAAAEHRRDVAREVERQRVRDDARTTLAAERAAADLSPLPAPVSLTDALAVPREAPRWRVDGLLHTDGNVVLAAVQKAGKTTLVGELARSLADGAAFLGRFDVTAPAGRVALLNYEMDGQMQTDWLGDLGIEHPERVVKLDLRGHRLPLLTRPGVEWLAEQLHTADVEAMIVDPFGAAYLSAGGTEIDSNNGLVGQFLYALNEVKQLAGVGELVIAAHAKRDTQEGAERARGPAILGDWPDATWVLTRDRQGRRFFKATEGRDVAVSEQRLFMDPTTRRLTLEGGNRAGARTDELRAAALAWIAAHPAQPKGDVEAALADRTHTRAAVRAVVNRLKDDALVQQEIGPRNAHLLTVTDVGAREVASQS